MHLATFHQAFSRVVGDNEMSREPNNCSQAGFPWAEAILRPVVTAAVATLSVVAFCGQNR